MPLGMFMFFDFVFGALLIETFCICFDNKLFSTHHVTVRPKNTLSKDSQYAVYVTAIMNF